MWKSLHLQVSRWVAGIMLISYKTEINPTEKQKQKIIQSIGVARFLYNQYISYNIRRYRMYQRGMLDDSQKRFISGYDFDKYVNNVLKKKEEFEWISLCGSKARKKAIMNAEMAFKNFFKGKSKFPRFKKKSQQDVKIYFPKDHTTDWTIERHRVKIPTFGFIRIKEFGYLSVGLNVSSGTVSYEAGRFYVSVLIDIDENSKYNKDLEISYKQYSDGIGIDLGIKDLSVISNGKVFKSINKSSKVKRLEKRLRREQRRFSRKLESKKRKGGTATTSANIEKQRLKVQKLHRRISNIRADYENKVVHEIVKQKPRFITIEDLNVKGMMKNRHLAKSVAAQRFFSLREKLEIKSKIIGIELRIVDRFYPSSKTCSSCGHIKKDLKLKDRTYRCEECGYVEDRDLNAALNLRDAQEYRIA